MPEKDDEESGFTLIAARLLIRAFAGFAPEGWLSTRTGDITLPRPIGIWMLVQFEETMHLTASGWIPFCAMPTDTMPHGVDIYWRAIDGEFGSIYHPTSNNFLWNAQPWPGPRPTRAMAATSPLIARHLEKGPHDDEEALKAKIAAERPPTAGEIEWVKEDLCWQLDMIDTTIQGGKSPQPKYIEHVPSGIGNMIEVNSNYIPTLAPIAMHEPLYLIKLDEARHVMDDPNPDAAKYPVLGMTALNDGKPIRDVATEILAEDTAIHRAIAEGIKYKMAVKDKIRASNEPREMLQFFREYFLFEPVPIASA